MHEGLRFTKDHEWIEIRDELSVIGISDFAQMELGDIVSIELPKIGSTFKKTQTMAIVDSVKASSDIYCPIDGEVVQVNTELVGHPEILNQSPYEKGWIVKLKPNDLGQLEGLMTEQQYQEYIGIKGM